jgi:molecular chaperone GrpE
MEEHKDQVEVEETTAEETAQEETVLEETVEEAEDPRTREQLIAELEDYKNRYLRTQADFDNFRRRSRQEKEEFAAYANAKLIEEFLPVLDTFEMALKSSENTDVKTLLAGVEMVYRQMTNVLQNYGLQPIEALGQPFDPNLHEGIMQVESADHPSNTVVEELRKGYRLREKVIRPSMVKVSQ